MLKENNIILFAIQIYTSAWEKTVSDNFGNGEQWFTKKGGKSVNEVLQTVWLTHRQLNLKKKKIQ